MEGSPAVSTQFINSDTGKLSAVLIAEWIASDLGRGIDGAYYEYADGIYQTREGLIKARVAAALADKYSATVQGQVEAHLLNVTIPQVGPPVIPGAGYLDHIVLQNGVYYWQTDEFGGHDPLLGAINRLQFRYDPDAACPVFQDWLAMAFENDTEVIRHVWEILGYLLMTGNPDQLAFLFYGEGGNGKGTLMRVIEHMVGVENMAALTLHQIAEGKFELATLYGKMINLAGDVSSRYIENPEVFKTITGDDFTTTSHKFGAPFKFKSYAVPVFSVNNYFRTSDSSEGWRRRWLALDFNVPLRGRFAGFNEQDLYGEAAGIFNEAMVALRRLMQRTSRPRFDPPRAVKEATRKMHDEADPFMMWFDSENVIHGVGQTETRAAVYKHYTKWSRDNGYQALAHGPFGQRLKQAGVGTSQSRAGGSYSRLYTGIGVMIDVHDS